MNPNVTLTVTTTRPLREVLELLLEQCGLEVLLGELSAALTRYQRQRPGEQQCGDEESTGVSPRSVTSILTHVRAAARTATRAIRGPRYRHYCPKLPSEAHVP